MQWHLIKVRESSAYKGYSLGVADLSNCCLMLLTMASSTWLYISMRHCFTGPEGRAFTIKPFVLSLPF